LILCGPHRPHTHTNQPEKQKRQQSTAPTMAAWGYFAASFRKCPFLLSPPPPRHTSSGCVLERTGLFVVFCWVFGGGGKGGIVPCPLHTSDPLPIPHTHARTTHALTGRQRDPLVARPRALPHRLQPPQPPLLRSRKARRQQRGTPDSGPLRPRGPQGAVGDRVLLLAEGGASLCVCLCFLVWSVDRLVDMVGGGRWGLNTL
jgi:hypothetical protein